MKVTYYPGCTLYTKAKNLGDLAVASASELGIELVELEDWTCCQATFPLVDDNLMGMLSSARILMNAEKLGPKITTLCSFCYNVLKRTNDVLKNDEEKRAKICEFLEDEYRGEIEVVHLLEILKDDVGFEKLKDSVKKELSGLKVVPYYGCQIVRPASVLKFDDPENPMMLDDFLESIGCEVIDFPFKVECCGSYQVIHPEVKETALKCSHNILKSALTNGAEAIALTCPVCYYNLDKKQDDIAECIEDFERIPILYFTELLGLALSVDPSLFDFSKHAIDPRPLLKKKGFLKVDRIKEEAK
jgi:heterodisulfide reductase subunit B